MNPITKILGKAFLSLGGRLTRASEGDYSIAVFSEETDPRARARQVIIVRGSTGFQVGWQYVCPCGVINPVEVLWTDRKLTCYGCHQEFCIKTLIENTIRRARFEANKLGGRNIKVDGPIKQEEWDNAIANLPSLTPSTRTDRRQEMVKQIMGDDSAGEVTYEPSDLSTGGFADPFARRRF